MIADKLLCPDAAVHTMIVRKLLPGESRSAAALSAVHVIARIPCTAGTMPACDWYCLESLTDRQ